MRMPGRFVAFLTGLSLLLAGCWDNRPIDTRALVLMMGVWPATGGRVEVAMEIPTPSGLTTLTGGGTSAGSQGASAAYYVLTGTGSNVMSALSNAESMANGDVYLGQTGMVILSTELSPQARKMALEALARIGSFDKTAYLGVTESSERAFMDFTPPSSPLPALYFLNVFGCKSCMPVALDQTVWTSEQDRYTAGVSLWLPLLVPAAKGFRINQMVLFRDNRLAAILSPTATRWLGMALGRTHKAAFGVMTIFPGAPVAVRAVTAKSSPSYRMTHGQLHLRVALNLVGTVDLLPAGDATAPTIHRLDTALARMVAHKVAHALVLAQKLGVDPVGFGRAYLFRHPHAGREWARLYRRAPVTVTVRAVIHNLGDLT